MMKKANYEEEIVGKLFNKYDKDKDGKLNSEEILNMIHDTTKKLNLFDQSYQSQQSQIYYQEVLDFDKDGKVNEKDLLYLYQSYFKINSATAQTQKKKSTKLFSIETEKKISVARKLFAQSYSLKSLEFDDLEKLLIKIFSELEIHINFEILKKILLELYTDKNINSLDQFQNFFLSCLEKLGIQIEYDIF